MYDKTNKKLELLSDIYKHSVTGDLRMDRHYNGQAPCGNNININIDMFDFNQKKDDK